MRKLPTSVIILMTIWFLFVCLIAGVSLLAVVLSAANLGGGLPLRYLDQTNFPVIMVAFPVFGMLLACVIALVMRSRREVVVETAIAEKTAPSNITKEPASLEVYSKAA
jgi:hypothetical protein